MVAYTKDGKNVYESKRLDYLGLVAGMFDELGLGEVVDKALNHDSGTDALNITFGCFRDHRPDLKQFMISLMVEPQHGVPWRFKALDSNTSDQTHFPQVIGELTREARDQPGRLYLVADSASCLQAGFQDIDTVYWIARMPHTHALAKRATHRDIRKPSGPLGQVYPHHQQTRSTSPARPNILSHYEGQNQVEKGFRLLKSPLYMVEPVFLKKPKRIVALIVCLALMVYAIRTKWARVNPVFVDFSSNQTKYPYHHFTDISHSQKRNINLTNPPLPSVS